MIWNDSRDWSEMVISPREWGEGKAGGRLLKHFAMSTKLRALSRRAGKSVCRIEKGVRQDILLVFSSLLKYSCCFLFQG